MSMVKVAGRYASNVPVVTLTEVTKTAGLMQTDGTIVPSNNYVYTQKIAVTPGDVVTYVNSADVVYPWRVVTAFMDDAAISEAGYYPASADRTPYTVPSGVNFIVITGQSADTVPLYAKRTSTPGIAKGIAVDENGQLIPNRAWASRISLIADELIRDTSGHAVPDESFSLDEYAISSLRVQNTLGQPVGIIFYDDIEGQPWLSDAYGGTVSITIPSDNTTHIITAEDVPALNYLRSLRVRLACATAPATGHVKVWVVSRR